MYYHISYQVLFTRDVFHIQVVLLEEKTPLQTYPNQVDLFTHNVVYSGIHLT